MRRFFFNIAPTRTACAQAVLAVALSTPMLVFGQAKDTTRPTKAEEKKEPTAIGAEQMTGRPDREVYLDRDVEIIRGQTTINSDKATYFQEENIVEGEGNVRMIRYGDRYWGEKLRYKLDTGEGWLLKPRYKFKENNAQGKGERADFLSEDRAKVKEGTYSTCEGDHPDWYVKSKILNIDQGTDTGQAESATLFFKQVPILGAPSISFPLSEGRKSGLLSPTFGTTSTGGFEAMVPYYFNIAPNRDLTLYPKIISKRGVQLGADARYLDRNYAGETQFEFLPNDLITGTNRYAISSVHTQKLTPDLTLGWNLNHVSDDKYFSDFTNHIDGMSNSLSGLTNGSMSPSAQRLLSRELGLTYSGSNWVANARVTNYQVLQDVLASPADQLVRPYQRLPQVSFKAWQPSVSGLDWGANAEWTRFWLSESDLQYNKYILDAAGISSTTRVDRGDRLMLTPQVSYSVMGPGYFIKPKLSLSMTHYQLENPIISGRPDMLNRTVPTFSVDSGLVFERETTLGGMKMTQTLEPRLFYVYTPYRDQHLFPNFDSAEPGFGFAQLFSENRFSGSDRISDANQLTAALVSRYIEPSGAERAKFAIGQRFYFRDQQVLLDSQTSESRSDLLLAAEGRLSSTVKLEGAVQYNQSQGQATSGNLGIQWRPGYKQVFNASYRYLRSVDADYVGINQFNLSGQWPIANGWHAVGLVSYSIPDSKVVQSMVGFEYDGGCWVFRFVGQRVYTATSNAGSAIFAQLQLNGLSRIGTGAIEALRKAIPGYQYQEPGNAAFR